MAYNYARSQAHPNMPLPQQLPLSPPLSHYGSDFTMAQVCPQSRYNTSLQEAASVKNARLRADHQSLMNQLLSAQKTIQHLTAGFTKAESTYEELSCHLSDVWGWCQQSEHLLTIAHEKLQQSIATQLFQQDAMNAGDAELTDTRNRMYQQQSINDQLRLDIEDLKGQSYSAWAHAAAASAAYADLASGTTVWHGTITEVESACSRCGQESRLEEEAGSGDTEAKPRLVRRYTE